MLLWTLWQVTTQVWHLGATAPVIFWYLTRLYHLSVFMNHHSTARGSAIQWLAGAGLCTGWAPALNCSRPLVTSPWHTVLCPLGCPVCPQCCPQCPVCPQWLVAGGGQTEDAEEQVPHGPGQPGHPELDTAAAATALTHRYLLPPITLSHQLEEYHACS